MLILKGGGLHMKRNAIQELIAWKNSEERKPMVLKGARQVGKTWIMKEFGKTHYNSYVYFNFDEDDELKSIFEINKNPHRIIELLSIRLFKRDSILKIFFITVCQIYTIIIL